MKKIIVIGSTGASVLLPALALAGSHSASIPEISAGFAPLAIAVAVGVVVAFREITRRK